MFSHGFGLRQTEPGDCSGEAIPVPIPNTEVKLSSAENTEGAAPRQDRSSPGSLASWVAARAILAPWNRAPAPGSSNPQVSSTLPVDASLPTVLRTSRAQSYLTLYESSDASSVGRAVYELCVKRLLGRSRPRSRPTNRSAILESLLLRELPPSHAPAVRCDASFSLVL